MLYILAFSSCVYQAYFVHTSCNRYFHDFWFPPGSEPPLFLLLQWPARWNKQLVQKKCHLFNVLSLMLLTVKHDQGIWQIDVIIRLFVRISYLLFPCTGSFTCFMSQSHATDRQLAAHKISWTAIRTRALHQRKQVTCTVPSSCPKFCQKDYFL